VGIRLNKRDLGGVKHGKPLKEFWAFVKMELSVLARGDAKRIKE
jgi:hypothetical protein